MIPRLSIRSEFSFRRCYGRAPRIVERLQDIGCPAACIMDDDGTWGHADWEKACVAGGVAPLFGTRLGFDLPGDKRGFAPVLGDSLARLYRLSSAPPSAPEGLSEYKDLIRFAGSANTDPECFDYIDINQTSKIELKRKIQLSVHTKIPMCLMPYNDYPFPEDRSRFLLWDDSKRMCTQHIMDDDELRLEFSMLDDDQWKQAVHSCYEIVERIGPQSLMKAPMIDVHGDLMAEVLAGMHYRIGKGHITEWTDAYQQRFEYEMALIKEKKYESYFLVVGDMVRWAKERMLVGPGRGSSAGSLICYLLAITEVDPLVHGLLFERFIDVNRMDLPDIDVDFSDKNRHLVFEYMSEKYGASNVARLGNISRLQSRSVIHHAVKKLGIPVGEGYSVANVLIEHSSGDARYGKGLEDTLIGTGPGRTFLERNPEAKIMADLEDHASHTSVHAAGLLVSHEKIIDYCTVRNGIAHLDKINAEYLNLLKIDVLGLRTLGVIEDANVITQEQLYSLPLDDPKAFETINNRKFAGLFQFEGASQRRVTTQIPIDCFAKIDHVTALARPGPLGGGGASLYIDRNAGRKPVTYIHPSMADYLDETQGVAIYQESVMRLVREIGGFDWKKTSIIRKGMSASKGPEFFSQYTEDFVEGASKHGIDRETAFNIFYDMRMMGAWCIVGETKIKLGYVSSTLGSEPTIKELYEYHKMIPEKYVNKRKPNPSLLAFDGQAAKPINCIDIYHVGHKPCIKITMEDGREISCTKEHKFIINGEWKRCGEAKIGDEFLSVGKTKGRKPYKYAGKGRGWKPQSEGIYDHDRSKAMIAFAETKSEAICEDCGSTEDLNMHHNDFNYGIDKPYDITWLCNSCHRNRHIEYEGQGAPMSIGWLPNDSAIVSSIEDIGMQDTYDIEMPSPNNNYVLANGIVAHNTMNKSHTVSYAIISYWCAYIKAYWPIEYAAALLRNAKDDEQTIETLRELQAEGIEIIPFDPELSDVDWQVIDGKLIGGYKNLVGIGRIKATVLLERRAKGLLRPKDIERIAKSEVKFSELNPTKKRWADIYQNPSKHSINGRVREIGDLSDGENAVIICRVDKVDRRDENESVRIGRRGGKPWSGQSLFLDVHVSDDSVSRPILARVRPENWFSIGLKIADGAAPKQDWLLIRGRWLAEFNMMIVKKVRCLTNSHMFD